MKDILNKLVEQVAAIRADQEEMKANQEEMQRQLTALSHFDLAALPDPPKAKYYEDKSDRGVFETGRFSKS